MKNDEYVLDKLQQVLPTSASGNTQYEATQASTVLLTMLRKKL